MEAGAKGTQFAAALQNADAKPARKSATAKFPGDRPTSGRLTGGQPTGSQPPGSGNTSPPPALPAVVAAPSLAGALPGGGADGTSAISTAQGSIARGTSANGAAPLAAASPSLDMSAPMKGADPSDNRTLESLAAARVREAPAAAAPGTATAIAANAATAAADKAAAGATAAPNDAAPAGAAVADGAGAGAGAAAAIAAASISASPAVTAAAMSAGASGAIALASGAADSAPSNDGAATPAGGVALDAMRPAGDAVPAPGNGVSGAVAVAQAVSSSAAGGVADKHAHSAGGDASSSGPPGGGGAAGASLLNPNPASTDAVAAPALKVAAGVESPEFGAGVAVHVSWMVDNNLNGAKLQVNPPQLGPIEVRIAVQGDHAQIWLLSHSAVTRDALESSSPHLREMLGAQGFSSSECGYFAALLSRALDAFSTLRLVAFRGPRSVQRRGAINREFGAPGRERRRRRLCLKALDHSAIDGNDLTGDVGGFVGGEKSHQGGHLFGGPGTLHRHERGNGRGIESGIAHAG